MIHKNTKKGKRKKKTKDKNNHIYLDSIQNIEEDYWVDTSLTL